MKKLFLPTTLNLQSHEENAMFYLFEWSMQYGTNNLFF